MGKEHEFDESLMPAEEPSEIGAIVLTEQHMAYARSRWPEASLQMQRYRVRQAIWARFQHRKPHPDDPTRSLLGGPQPNSGPKVTKAIGRAVVEHFEGRQKEVIDAIASALHPSEDSATRHKAGMNILKHAREEAREEREADDYARRTDDDIRREFARMLAEGIRSGEYTIQDIIDSTADDITDQDEPRQIAS